MGLRVKRAWQAEITVMNGSFFLGRALVCQCSKRCSLSADTKDEESLADTAARNGTYNPTTVPISTGQKPGTSQGFDNPAMESDFPRVFQSMQRHDDELV
ncbi:hypothetical protein PR048_019559 [Dryococelus australis]|uniref:Uncharacterized protein n=1 Tax=Dryococelus australis TaxID=614101 RepID=A0ABQ9H3S7_9NEOP|nr:hypothetical protein PR048_019559 [Dryococelus australis]